MLDKIGVFVERARELERQLADPAVTRDHRRFAEVGVEVVYFPYTVHTSSTSLRRALTLLEGGGPVPSLAVGG